MSEDEEEEAEAGGGRRRGVHIRDEGDAGRRRMSYFGVEDDKKRGKRKKEGKGRRRKGADDGGGGGGGGGRMLDPVVVVDPFEQTAHHFLPISFAEAHQPPLTLLRGRLGAERVIQVPPPPVVVEKREGVLKGERPLLPTEEMRAVDEELTRDARSRMMVEGFGDLDARVRRNSAAAAERRARGSRVHPAP